MKANAIGFERQLLGCHEEWPLLTTEEAARLLSVSPDTLKAWRVRKHQSGPDFIRMGGGRKPRVRYSPGALRAFLSGQTVQPGGVDRQE